MKYTKIKNTEHSVSLSLTATKVTAKDLKERLREFYYDDITLRIKHIIVLLT
jgi:hypothetical protein